MDLPQGTKLFVFWSCISTFLKVWRSCYQPAKISIIFHKGTKIIVDVICKSKHKYGINIATKRKWCSSRKHFIGCIYCLDRGDFQTSKRNDANYLVLLLSHKTFYKILKTLLIPAIDHVFNTQRQLLYGDVQERGEIDFLGDGRCDRHVIMQNMVCI